jgi:hypothetical protein
MEAVMWLVVVGTSIWVAVDAANLGARSGVLGGGFFDMGVAGWLACCLLFWIVGFPAYLVTRSRYAEHKKATMYGQPAYGLTPGFGPSVSGHPAFAAPPNSEPNPMVPDQQWSLSPTDAPGVVRPGAVVDDLARLVALRDSGAVSPAEFDVLKARLLSQPEP